MSVSIKIKKSISYPISFSINIAKHLTKWKLNEYIILMYHRINKRNTLDSYIQEGMYVDPYRFYDHIKYLKEKYHVVSLDKLFSGGNNELCRSRDKVLCALTFDDGWSDFYENAFPALKSCDVCATVFLPTDYIGTNRIFWTDKLACILHGRTGDARNSQIRSKKYDSIIEKIENRNGSTDFQLESAIGELKSLPTEVIGEILEILAKRWMIPPVSLGRSFLSWDEVKEMHVSGIVSFGSHTKTHRILTTVPEDVVREELVQSKNALLSAGVVAQSFIPFAYPNGNYTERIAQIVQEAGYSIAVTTERGWNRFDGSGKDAFRLRRIGIHQDVSSTNSMLDCRIYGIY